MSHGFGPLRIFLSVLPVLVFPCLGMLCAEEIVLENGDRLTGTISLMENGKLTVTTEYAGAINVDATKIKTIVTDKPAEVHLESGEVLRGKIETVEEGQLMVEPSEERGPTVVEWSTVKSINPSFKKWIGGVTIGANLQSGNTDRMSASVGSEATRKTDNARFTLRLLYNYAEEREEDEEGEEDTELTARSTYGALKYDYFWTRSLYTYLSVEMLSDEFKDLNLRTVVGPGLGYQIWDDDVKQLLLEAGLAYFSEDLDEGADDSWVTGRLAANVSYTIMEKVVFSDQLVIYPGLEEFGEYQLRNEAAITSALFGNWALRFSNIIEHDSDPPAGVKKNDIYWIIGMQYMF